MGSKINKCLLLISIILLQSCSGGRIGNFLENSFKNIEETKTKEDVKNDLKNKVVKKSEKKLNKNKNIEETKTKEDVKNDLKNKVVKKSEKKLNKNKNVEVIKNEENIKNDLRNEIVSKKEKKSKNNKKIIEKNISFQKRKFKPQSYKIIFILKDVDPKDPTENLRKILRNSNVNFEIEKIERFSVPQNKSIKRD